MTDKTKMTDGEFLLWIHTRLECRYEENPQSDYMIRLGYLAAKLQGEQPTEEEQPR